MSDAGDYRCRVDFRKARTVNTVISLKVIVPPEEPLITDLDGNELKGLVGPFNEGDELRLICNTNGGKLALKLVNEPRTRCRCFKSERDHNLLHVCERVSS